MIGSRVERERMMGNIMFKKRKVHNWVKMARGALVDRVLLDLVLISRRFVRRLLYVRVLSMEGEVYLIIFWWMEDWV